MSGQLRTPGLRARLAVTVSAVVLHRLGQSLPSPGVDVRAAGKAAGDAVRADPFLGLVDLLSGGGLLRLSVLGLGVLPYAAAAFVIGLLVRTSARMRARAGAGSAGTAGLLRDTWILSVVLGALMGTAVAVAAARERLPGGDVLAGTGRLPVLEVAVCLTAGTAVTAWLIRLVSAGGLGDGLALLFLTQLAAVFPDLLLDVRETEGDGTFAAATAAVLVSGLLVMLAVLVLGRAERRVPVQHARRTLGHRRHQGATVHLPFRLDHLGLLPVFTALALLHLPALATRLRPGGGRPDGLWTHPDQSDPRFLAALFVLTTLFSVIGSAGVVDIPGIVRRLTRDGGFVPGIRPGPNTADYLTYVRRRTGALAPVVLGVAAVLPAVSLALAGVSGGSSLTGACVLILTGAGLSTALRTLRQAESGHRRPERGALFRPPGPRGQGSP